MEFLDDIENGVMLPAANVDNGMALTAADPSKRVRVDDDDETPPKHTKHSATTADTSHDEQHDVEKRLLAAA